MVDPQITKKLLATLNITQPTLSKRAKRIKKLYGPMNTDEAVYVIAQRAGVDLSKSLPLSLQDRIRSLVPRELPTKERAIKPQTKHTKSKPRTHSISCSFVSLSTVKIALSLGDEFFPYVFVLENSIRELIKGRLSKVGRDWWNKCVDSNIKGNVKRTMDREQAFPYRRARGSDPLSYANFADLKRIILGNPDHFKEVLIRPDWFSAGMDDVYLARNKLAHSIPLDLNDKRHILTFFSEWVILTEKIVI